uniref:Uncharacterized protein n=1 Tax=Cyprinus carpio carpio TaxID=630221 RepID=A0A9J7ZKT5_CYPCA
MPRRKRNAGSSSEGTEDSDFSAEHTDSSESDVHTVRNTRLTRSSLRLSRNSQDSSPVGNRSALVSEDVVNSSTRRVTRSQQQGVSVLPKKYPLRQSRSSGSDTEQLGEISERVFSFLHGSPQIFLSSYNMLTIQKFEVSKNYFFFLLF